MENNSLRNIKNNLIEANTITSKLLLSEIKKYEDNYERNPKLLIEHLEFLSQSYYVKQSEIIRFYNKQISDGIEGLAQQNDWVSLGSVARHAIERKKEIAKNSDSKLELIIDVSKNILKFMHLSLDDQDKALKSLEKKDE